MFILMLVVANKAVRFAESENKSLYLLFFLAGILTAFFDFLTTETLVLLIPLLLSIRIVRRKGGRSLWGLSLKSVFLWGTGYVSAWVSKWLLASFVLGVNVIPYIREHFFAHFGAYDDISAFQQIVEALYRNISMLFPIGYGIAGWVIFVMLIILGIILARKQKVTLRKNADSRIILLYLFLGLIVYARFILIRHHGWFHYFFTYRAQASVILSFCFIVLELVEKRNKKPEKFVIKKA